MAIEIRSNPELELPRGSWVMVSGVCDLGEITDYDGHLTIQIPIATRVPNDKVVASVWPSSTKPGSRGDIVSVAITDATVTHNTITLSSNVVVSGGAALKAVGWSASVIRK